MRIPENAAGEPNFSSIRVKSRRMKWVTGFHVSAVCVCEFVVLMYRFHTKSTIKLLKNSHKHSPWSGIHMQTHHRHPLKHHANTCFKVNYVETLNQYRWYNRCVCININGFDLVGPSQPHSPGKEHFKHISVRVGFSIGLNPSME